MLMCYEQDTAGMCRMSAVCGTSANFTASLAEELLKFVRYGAQLEDGASQTIARLFTQYKRLLNSAQAPRTVLQNTE